MSSVQETLAAIWSVAVRVVRDLMPYGAVRLLQNRTNYGTLIRPKNINTPVHWNRKLAKEADGWRDEPYHVLAEFLPQDTPFTLLDIGCALGDGLEWLARRFPQAALFGIDFSSVGIAKARARMSAVTYSLMDVMRQRLQGLWDYVCLIETLEHLSDPYRVLDQAVSCARVAVFVSVPFTPDGPRGPYAGREHVWRFGQQAFDRYAASVLVRDFLNGGKMSRMLFRIPGQGGAAAQEKKYPGH